MSLHFVERSAAPARAVPVRPGATPPKPERARTAGFAGRAGEVADISGRKRRVLLLGMGDAPDPAPDKFEAAGNFEAAGALAAARLRDLPHIALDARDLTPREAGALAAGALLRAWRYDHLITRPTPPRELSGRTRIQRIDVLVEDVAAAHRVWRDLEPAIDATLFARDLVATPSNMKPPLALAEQLRALAADGVDVEIHDADALRRFGCGAHLAVGSGSAHPPCLVVLRWPGSFEAPPLAIVGKGITFDTGGVCIKPAAGMWEMRADMAGAAAAAAAMRAIARRRSPAPVTAILPLAENAIGAAAFRPSDVVRLVDGSTVEVVDTDAEGRLVLADAILWTRDHIKPQAIVDLATLTGSIVTALGHHMAGLFCNDDPLAAHLAAAGAATGQPCWRMPWQGYGDALRSDIADLRHCSDGTRQPDACHGAAFLREFVGDTPWAHLDIAGVESRETPDDRHPAGPTGWGVRLLDRLVTDRFEDPDR